MKKRSIKNQFLYLFLPLFLLLFAVTAAISYELVQRYATELFDKDLINSVDSVVARVQAQDGKLVVDMPEAAQDILKYKGSEHFYYCVRDANGVVVSGDKNMPKPTEGLALDTPVVRSERIPSASQWGDLRIAEVKVVAPGSDVIGTVQVAETATVLHVFFEHMLQSIIITRIITILLAVLGTYYGVVTILKPLNRFKLILEKRDPKNLDALPTDDMPVEVTPLVKAMNDLLGRLRDDTEVRQRFIANAAHQLRTPLAGLKTYSSLGTQLSDVEELKQVMRKLDEGIDRTAKAVSQLLALARLDDKDTPNLLYGPVDLREVVTAVVEEQLVAAVRKNIDLQCDLGDEFATIYGDTTSLTHLAANVIDNALLYTPEGGSVIITLKAFPQVILTVTDTGVGIPESEREKVFERFHRVIGNSQTGTGLGLAIVKEIATMHYATVTAEANPAGKGTKVSVIFSPKVKELALAEAFSKEI